VVLGPIRTTPAPAPSGGGGTVEFTEPAPVTTTEPTSGSELPVPGLDPALPAILPFGDAAPSGFATDYDRLLGDTTTSSGGTAGRSLGVLALTVGLVCTGLAAAHQVTRRWRSHGTAAS
jgi:hypothetical protein